MIILHVMTVWQKQFFKEQLKEAEKGVNQENLGYPASMNGYKWTYISPLLCPRSPTVEKFVQVSWYPYGISHGKMMMMMMSSCTK